MGMLMNQAGSGSQSLNDREHSEKGHLPRPRQLTATASYRAEISEHSIAHSELPPRAPLNIPHLNVVFSLLRPVQPILCSNTPKSAVTFSKLTLRVGGVKPSWMSHTRCITEGLLLSPPMCVPPLKSTKSRTSPCNMLDNFNSPSPVAVKHMLKA